MRVPRPQKREPSLEAAMHPHPPADRADARKNAKPVGRQNKKEQGADDGQKLYRLFSVPGDLVHKTKNNLDNTFSEILNLIRDLAGAFAQDKTNGRKQSNSQ